MKRWRYSPVATAILTMAVEQLTDSRRIDRCTTIIANNHLDSWILTRALYIIYTMPCNIYCTNWITQPNTHWTNSIKALNPALEGAPHWLVSSPLAGEGRTLPPPPLSDPPPCRLNTPASVNSVLRFTKAVFYTS